jgi:predicted enzyme related to lactoylglutathione lyase
VDSYPQGAPCWFELATPDQNGAKQFYTGLLGWTVFDAPMGPDEVYSMFKLDGRDVGAAFKLPDALKAQGIPPHWAVYFSVNNVDDSAAKVKELGGTIIQGPFDVMDVGRMVVCKDPGDAVFQLWQGKTHKGTGVYNENNTVGWSELASRDVPRVREFYANLLGWETKGAANMPTYIEFYAGGEPRGGLLPMDEQWQGIPSHWGIYFRVADCDATAEKAKQTGATIMHGPFSIPNVGRMAMMRDPQGAMFSIIQLQRTA